MTKVKICGITNLPDALSAAELGADAIGLNFCRLSPRYIEPRQARLIGRGLGRRVLKVGVFVDESIEMVESIAQAASLDVVQLHGGETAKYVDRLIARTRLPVIKAFRVSNGFDPESMRSYRVDHFLLDAWSSISAGGTGETCDWTIARKAERLFPGLFLAGGLNAENVVEAITAVRPYAVDACSGLEKEKGIKDIEKMRLFIERAKLL